MINIMANFAGIVAGNAPLTESTSTGQISLNPVNL